MRNRAIKTHKRTKDLALKRCIEAIDAEASTGVFNLSVEKRRLRSYFPVTSSSDCGCLDLEDRRRYLSYTDVILSQGKLKKLGYCVSIEEEISCTRPAAFLPHKVKVTSGEDIVHISWNNEAE